MDTKGRLIVISGFSGVGKGTVIRRLMDHHDSFSLSVSCTTRYRREGEVDGRDYFFLPKERFEKGIREGHFLEYAEYAGNYYGTPADYVFGQREQGKNVILDIEVQGGFQVREKVPDAMMIFLVPPSARVLVERLLHRGTETEDQIRLRMAQALTEADAAYRYEAILVNDRLEQTEADLLSLVENPERMKDFYRKNSRLIQQIRSDLNGILKTW